MSLSVTETLHNGHSRNTRQFKFRKESLIYGPATTDSTVVQTRIWRHARSTNGYFIDISLIPGLEGPEHMQALQSQYNSPNMDATLYFSKKGGSYIECYPPASIVQKFITEGVFYETINTRLIPCKAIEGSGEVLEVNLLDLPMIEKNRLAAGLQATFQQYGVVLDIGQYIAAKWQVFMGEGYATLYLDNNVEYPPLTHELPLFESDYFHITYPNMNTWCRYCHEDGHTKLTCEKLLARTFCYGCDEYGHKKQDCPRLQKSKMKK